MIEPVPLDEMEKRLRCIAGKAAAAGEGQVEPANRAFDDRGKIKRQKARGAEGDPAAARFVAREGRLIEEQNRHSRAAHSRAAVLPAGPLPTTITS